MNATDDQCQVPCYEACERADCPAEPEDALLDLNKMTPEEMKEYLDSLQRNRSLSR